ncbi:hypothetical protein MON38_10545 [Hymenobacter sp. DH14]|uniref:DUF4145 domain-containing protein n=1 Tax=Hymenobacter cyanobacteriorum TaxID=2926463 RepID=A0A9X1VEV0_9BACT|nr:hypothetical protein [Hymenobacter cyanobacteriorum]MCI1187859.1 hypothetical protein [Hymenobacter cyanobacteriorum]
MYYQPDDRWPRFGAPTREQFEALYVFPPRFHAGVPEDVVKSYTTASHLMALAWYHYPVYDEALNKLLLMLEMAIRLRCQQLGLPAGANRSLQQLIKALEAAEPAKQLGWWLDGLRRLRNRVAHPEEHSFGGVVFRLAMLRMVNTLNQLFEDEAAVTQGLQYCAALADFANQPLEWSTSNPDMFRPFTHARPLRARHVDSEWRVVWALFPSLPNCMPTVTVVVGALEEKGFRGVEVPSQQLIVLRPMRPEAIAYEEWQHRAQRSQISETERKLSEVVQESEMYRQQEEMIYRFLWV